MKELITPFKVGLVVLGSIAAAFAMHQVTSDEVQGDTYNVIAYMDDATGLAVKSRIQTAGIRVGEIQSIELDTIKRKQRGREVDATVAKITLRIEDAIVLKQGTPSTPLEERLQERVIIYKKESGEERAIYRVVGTPKAEEGEGLWNVDVKNKQGGRSLERFKGEIVTTETLKTGEHRLTRQQRGRVESTISDREIWRNGATISKIQQGVVGDQILSLAPGIEGEQIVDGGQIKNVETGSIFDKFDDIATNIVEITNALANSLGGPEGEETLKQIINNVKEVIAVLKALISDNQANFNRIVSDAKNTTTNVNAISNNARDDLNKIGSDIRKITGKVNNIVSKSGGEVQEGIGNLNGVLARLQNSLDTLNYSLQNVGEITDKINEGEGTIGVLVNDPSIAEDTQKIISDAGDFVNKMVDLKTIVELRSEYLFRQAALKNYVALRLQPNPNKYYLIELIDDPRGRRNLLQTTTLSTDPSNPSIIREDQVITTDDFKFSAQLARRWNFFTGRFGLIETTGGVGGDLHFLDDKLDIKLDVFDFGEDVNPRLRVSFAYTFFQYIYILGGTDDIFNDQTRDFFFGAALRFNDEDLKTILGSAPAPNF